VTRRRPYLSTALAPTARDQPARDRGVQQHRGIRPNSPPRPLGYDRAGTKPQFPFGHGLGFTTWAYESAAADAPAAAPDGDLAVTVVLRNTGPRAGREIVQAYVEPPTADPGRPVRLLAAFAAVTAAPASMPRPG